MSETAASPQLCIERGKHPFGHFAVKARSGLAPTDSERMAVTQRAGACTRSGKGWAAFRHLSELSKGGQLQLHMTACGSPLGVTEWRTSDSVRGLG